MIYLVTYTVLYASKKCKNLTFITSSTARASFALSSTLHLNFPSFTLLIFPGVYQSECLVLKKVDSKTKCA